MSLFNKKFMLKQSQTDGANNFIFTLFQLLKRSVSSLESSTSFKSITLLCNEIILFAKIQI